MGGGFTHTQACINTIICLTYDLSMRTLYNHMYCVSMSVCMCSVVLLIPGLEL